MPGPVPLPVLPGFHFYCCFAPLTKGDGPKKKVTGLSQSQGRRLQVENLRPRCDQASASSRAPASSPCDLQQVTSLPEPTALAASNTEIVTVPLNPSTTWLSPALAHCFHKQPCKMKTE